MVGPSARETRRSSHGSPQPSGAGRRRHRPTDTALGRRRRRADAPLGHPKAAVNAARSSSKSRPGREAVRRRAGPRRPCGGRRGRRRSGRDQAPARHRQAPGRGRRHLPCIRCGSGAARRGPRHHRAVAHLPYGPTQDRGLAGAGAGRRNTRPALAPTGRWRARTVRIAGPVVHLASALVIAGLFLKPLCDALGLPLLLPQ